jgi:hypothetical protein
MPANLNALIRYKVINSLLFGGRRRCDIYDLMDACTEALYEAKGRDRNKRISERQIRDDIRVMRSDILGYNAPIKQEGGYYFYSEPGYSITSAGLTDAGLVEKIIQLLLDIRPRVQHPELETVLKKVLALSPAANAQFLNERGRSIQNQSWLSYNDFDQAIPSMKANLADLKESIDLKQKYPKFISKPDRIILPPGSVKPDALVGFTWGEILKLLP